MCVPFGIPHLAPSLGDPARTLALPALSVRLGFVVTAFFIRKDVAQNVNAGDGACLVTASTRHGALVKQEDSRSDLRGPLAANA